MGYEKIFETVNYRMWIDEEKHELLIDTTLYVFNDELICKLFANIELFDIWVVYVYKFNHKFETMRNVTPLKVCDSFLVPSYEFGIDSYTLLNLKNLCAIYNDYAKKMKGVVEYVEGME